MTPFLVSSDLTAHFADGMFPCMQDRAPEEYGKSTGWETTMVADQQAQPRQSWQ